MPDKFSGLKPKGRLNYPHTTYLDINEPDSRKANSVEDGLLKGIYNDFHCSTVTGLNLGFQ